jgi:hypothetical protein
MQSSTCPPERLTTFRRTFRQSFRQCWCSGNAVPLRSVALVLCELRAVGPGSGSCAGWSWILVCRRNFFPLFPPTDELRKGSAPWCAHVGGLGPGGE